ncbi:sensor histidine kinase [Nocardioides sp. URHA0020]|uniref:sensor histidine kinase n=1 Tax=Nocardioides sp. URHA0020 TaxID=1380392 RepID=UPI0006845E5E|nr:ATP-binding protein [Nocardioides sp. URHA0020]
MTDSTGLERPVRGSRWSDAHARDALRPILDTLAEVAGSDVVGVSGIRDDGYLQVLCVVGPDDAQEVLVDSLAPVAELLEQLEVAEDWGTLKFVPHDRVNLDVERWGWVADGPRDVADGVWHPQDLLVAPISDDHGQLVGVLAIELPADQLLPTGGSRDLLEMYARQACRAIAAILESERLAEQIRLARAAANIVRRATGSMSAPEVLSECGAAIVDGFRAQALWTHLFGSEPRPVQDADPHSLPQELIEIFVRYSVAAWERQAVGVFAPDRQPPEPLEDADLKAVLEFVDAESLLVVPLGAGPECLGWIALTRGPGDAEWTAGEAEVAFGIGRDLGRALANASNYAREHRLVEELQELADYKSRLVATVSHELRTPLTSIVGFLELLEGDPGLSPRSRSAIQAIHRGSTRLSRVVEELLVLHRTADGELEAPTEVDLGAIVADIVELNEGPAAPRRIELTSSLPHAPVRVLGAAHELEHIVANLVSNAVKYTPDGGHVRVTLEEVDGEVVLTCTDDGIGISAEDQARVFEEFYRSADPDAAQRSGTGLGLAIVRRIVDRHRGGIELESVLGSGSTFRVRLPAL